MILYRTTKSLVDHEHESAAIERMLELGQEITARKAFDLIGEDDFQQLIDESCWDTFEEYSEDWSIDYSLSSIHRKTCVVVHTTETDFIFTSEDDAKAMHRTHNREPSPQEWRRAQGFGPSGATPDRPTFNNTKKR